MQKVAWPTTIVSTPKDTPNVSIAERSEIAVTIPGRAMGRTSRNDTVLRPKKSKRWTANAAALPRINASAVAKSAICSELISAWRTVASRNAMPNHFVV